jgi:cytochrome c5
VHGGARDDTRKYASQSISAGDFSRYTAPLIFLALRGKRIVSKQDTHFFNVFSLVIGLLVAVAILLFALSRIVAGRTQGQQVIVDPEYVASVESRIAPFARVAIAGQDNSALAIVEETPAGGAGGAASAPTTAEDVLNVACNACHGQGIAGAPRVGDAAAWRQRIAKGKDVLYMHAIQGFQGEAGLMPAKGGRADIPDDLVRAAVDLMVQKSQ